MTTFLLCWYALGWAGVGWLCKYRLSRLTACDLVAIMLWVPPVLMAAALAALLMAASVIDDPLLILGRVILVLSGTAGGLFVLFGIVVLHDRFGDACLILWRKP